MGKRGRIRLAVVADASAAFAGRSGAPRHTGAGDRWHVTDLSLARKRLRSGSGGRSPVVLLLGCSTQLTDVPFLNFVEAFKREKAALVIGTLATIRGRRAVAFVSELLEP